MAKYASRVKDTTTDTGTGSITLSGTAPTSYQSFANAFTVTTDYFPYFLLDSNGAWERGYGRLTASTTMERSFVIESTDSNNAITLSSGTHTVVCRPNNDARRYLGFTLGLTASQTLPQSQYTDIIWNAVEDDPTGFITSQLPTTVIPIPDWVDLIQVNVMAIINETGASGAYLNIIEIRSGDNNSYDPFIRLRQTPDQEVGQIYLVSSRVFNPRVDTVGETTVDGIRLTIYDNYSGTTEFGVNSTIQVLYVQ